MSKQCGVGLLLVSADQQAGPGRRVTGVKPGSPAEAAGKISIGDVLTHVDGNAIGEGSQLGLLGADGSTVQLRLARPSGESYELSLPRKPGPLGAQKQATGGGAGAPPHLRAPKCVGRKGGPSLGGGGCSISSMYANLE
uniref:PDZ domain-containing protein n=1 Tax=Hemiselmis andersenii TaxID=464988 RepID=A0A6U5AK67_HEMAN|mmetsp:Transcript_39722/g.92999  ORF Transcript_39722/g.92999 Transcript_39722/m.92999 type:complete len:139 (-) Transcript_39722:211-627(-)